jgi:hypothetical protein
MQYCSHTADKYPIPHARTHTATRDPLAPPVEHAVRAAPSASYQQCCWLPSRPSKTRTSLRHHRCSRYRHTVRHHHHHLTDQSCSTSHLTCAHHVSTHASHSTTTWVAESTQAAQSLQPLPLYISVGASWWCRSARTDRERAPVPDSQQHGLLMQHCSHTADKPPSLTHTATRHPLAPSTDRAFRAASSASYLQQCCWLPSRSSKTLTSLRHHRCC